MSKIKTNKAKKRGPKNRQGLYSVAASYSKEAIQVLVDLMRNSPNESVRMGAAKVILNKALPDLKATELVGEFEEPLKINVIKSNGFDPNEHG